MRLRRAKAARSGTTLAEAAIVLIVFVMCVLALFDLGMAVLRSNMIAAAARYGARKAVVHGIWAPEIPGDLYSGRWGTIPVRVRASETSTARPEYGIAPHLRPMLVGFDHQETWIDIEWGTNNPPVPGTPVTVTVTSYYQPITTWFFGSPRIPLRASSTMLVLH